MEIMLRYFQTYDKNGVYSQIELQYWDTEIYKWIPVSYVKCKECMEEVYLKDKDAR